MTTETCNMPQRLKELGIAIIIPTYNNGKTIGRVVDDVWQYCHDIFVVNDGCTDNTQEELAARPFIKVITHEQNMGKGVGLRNGLNAAREAGFRYAITIDSDGQHFAYDIPTFVEEIEKTPDALLVGARNLTADNMPGKNTFANKFSNFWFKLETGIKMDDTQSGYRLYPLKKIGNMKHYTAKYEFELEILVFSAWNGVSVRNIPIHVYYPPEGERVSHFRPLQDFTRISLVNTVLVLMAALWIWPRNFFRKLTWSNIKESANKLINSNVGNKEFTLSVMLGIFMGIIPIWGYQIICTIFMAQVLRLNKVISVIFSNISIPPMIPFILFGSYVTGCKVLGAPIEMSYQNISFENITQVLVQYLVGSVIFATICSIIAGILTYIILLIARKSKRNK